MLLKNIHISNFRNFKRKAFSFSPKTTVIVGPNTSGKTNIFEAIFLLAAGKSFKAQIEEEMISYGQEIARVKGEFLNPRQKLEAVLTRGEITVGEDPEKTERVPRKKLLINGIAKRVIDFAGNFRAVLFGPWDLELVTESPSVRRKFLDTLLSQVDREYRRASLSYEKGLRQRNRLLLRIREEGLSRSQLLFWDRLLTKNGDYINQRRREFLDFANAGSIQFPTWPPGRRVTNFQLEYDPSTISEVRLEQYAEEEVAAATTLVGPHRDDFIFKVKGKKQEVKGRELARYGSRGEQRMGVLWLKLAEFSFIEEKTRSTSSGQAGERPTLLLDDIFSELDHEHREVVMSALGSQQTIITTADPHFVEGLEKVERINLK